MFNDNYDENDLTYASKDNKYVFHADNCMDAEPEQPDLGTRYFTKYGMLGFIDHEKPVKAVIDNFFGGYTDKYYEKRQEFDNNYDFFNALNKIALKKNMYVCPIDVYEHDLRHFSIGTDEDWDTGIAGVAIYSPKWNDYDGKPEYQSRKDWLLNVKDVLQDANQLEDGTVYDIDLINAKNDEVIGSVSQCYFNENEMSNIKNILECAGDLIPDNNQKYQNADYWKHAHKNTHIVFDGYEIDED